MPMHYEAVFVFLSRVKFGRHAKILPLHPQASWNHLSNLRPNDDLTTYLGGFKSSDIFNVKDGQETVAAIMAFRGSTSRNVKGATKRKKQPVASLVTSLSSPASSSQQRVVRIPGKRVLVRRDRDAPPPNTYANFISYICIMCLLTAAL